MSNKKSGLGIVRGRLIHLGEGPPVTYAPWVQGIASSVDDIVLNGSKFSAEIGTVLEDATLTRSIEEASTLAFEIDDDSRRLIEHPILQEAFEVEVDGLGFKFVKASNSGLSEPLELTMEDLVVSRLRGQRGARKALRGKVTRAEFARMLVFLAKPRIPFYSPSLHKVQPIGNAAQATTAAAGKLVRREPGLPPNANVTVKGVRASKSQLAVMERVLDVGRSLKAPEKVLISAIVTVIQEANAENLTGGDRDSTGAFQQRASMGWPASGDVAKDAHAFYLGIRGHAGAIKVFKRNPSMSVNDIAQAVQASGTPTAYAQWASEATKTVKLYLGGTTAPATTASAGKVTGKYQFERTKKESTWDAITRLAKEVQWRCFVVAGVVYFISDDDLMRSTIRADIDDSTPGVEDTTFDYDVGKPVGEMQIMARAKAWAVPPGAVMNVSKHGPANGLYLVTKIEAPLRKANSLCTITLNRPTPALPEPAPTKSSTKGGKSKKVRSTGSTPSSSGLDGVKLDGRYQGTQSIIEQYVTPFMKKQGLSAGSAKRSPAANDAAGGASGSDHLTTKTNAYATDYPTGSGAKAANALGRAMGRKTDSTGTFERFNIKVGGRTFSVQILWAVPDHYDHVHVGIEAV